ncbi:MAG: hypothetical protein ACOVOR_05230 [Rhabdochlamydiaceae bacterium]
MRLFKFSKIFLTIYLLSFSFLFSDTIDNSSDRSQSDIDALKEWVNSRRQIKIKEMGGTLSIGGEVRAELLSGREFKNGVKQRGVGGISGLPKNVYDIEVNLMLDYRSERSWSGIKLEFDNDAGIYNGSLNKMKVEKAIIGYRLVDSDIYTVDLELGRRKMSSMVESKIMYSSFYDGFWLKWDRSYEKLGDLYAHGGYFIVDEKAHHYSYLFELGLLNLANTGFYTQYSLIDWHTKTYDDHIKREVFNFVVSHLTTGYKFTPKKLNKLVNLYLGGCFNHNAKKIDLSQNTRSNGAGYLGLSVGQLSKKGDWSLDINYQIVQAQAIPDFDNMCVGSGGNATDSGFYLKKIREMKERQIPSEAAGNGNCRGFQITFEYLLRDNLNIQQQWQQSITLNDHLGPFRKFNQYEIELVLSF